MLFAKKLTDCTVQPGQLEEVTAAQLELLVTAQNFVAVFFCKSVHLVQSGVWCAERLLSRTRARPPPASSLDI